MFALTSQLPPPPSSQRLTKSTMNAGNLDSLPLETLQRVAEFLDATHRPSLESFGLVNRACRQAAAIFLWRAIHITFDYDPEVLHRRVEALFKTISALGVGCHIRHVHVQGILLEAGAENKGADAEWLKDQHNRREDLFRRTGIPEILGDTEPCTYSAQGKCTPLSVSDDEDAAWAPLAGLIKNIPHVTKLLYDCYNQFPPCLLQAIHQHHPTCELHLLKFGLRSPETPDQHELALVTSPCLHSITLRCSEKWPSLEYHLNRRAVMQLAAGLAPNLKELRVIGVTSPTPNGGPARDLDLEPWRGIRGVDTKNMEKASLHCWSQTGTHPLDADFLQTWSLWIDFSCLRRLDLGAGHDARWGVTADALRCMALDRPFARLKTLRIRLARGPDEHNVDDLEFDGRAADFIESLEPLDEAFVSGLVRAGTLAAICRRHGPTLTSLGFHPLHRPGYDEDTAARVRANLARGIDYIPMTLEPAHVRQINASCPLLEHLEVPVRRLHPREAEVFQSVGELPRLRTALLTLDCSSPEVHEYYRERDGPPADYDEWDRCVTNWGPVTNGDLRLAFEKSAVDEALALSIWSAVCPPGRENGLRSLKLHTTGGGLFGSGGTMGHIEEVVGNLGRSWLIEASPRDYKGHRAVVVKELGSEARKTRDADYRLEDEASLPPHSAVHILRRIWPRTTDVKGASDWRRDWKGLPLHIDSVIVRAK